MSSSFEISSAFSPVPALIGGALIGLSASLFLALLGRVAGISGLLASAIDRGTPRAERSLSIWFLVGLLGAAVPLAMSWPARFVPGVDTPLGVLALAGLLVGYGTRLGSGCTSGHGVCGLSRLSLRSLVATLVFVAMAMVTVAIFGGIHR